MWPSNNQRLCSMGAEMQQESLNEFHNKPAEERIKILQNRYEPGKARPAVLLFKLYLMVALAMVVYATLFSVYGYSKLPMGAEIAEFCGQLPTEFLSVEAGFLQRHNVKQFEKMTERQSLRDTADRWAVNVRHGFAVYDFTLATTAEEYPLLKVYDDQGNEIINNVKPEKYKPIRHDDKENGGRIAVVYAGLHPGRPYIVEVNKPAQGSEKKHYVLRINLRGQDPDIFGLFSLVGKLILLTLPMAYFAMIILSVYLARSSQKPVNAGPEPTKVV